MGADYHTRILLQLKNAKGNSSRSSLSCQQQQLWPPAPGPAPTRPLTPPSALQTPLRSRGPSPAAASVPGHCTPSAGGRLRLACFRSGVRGRARVRGEPGGGGSASAGARGRAGVVPGLPALVGALRNPGSGSAGELVAPSLGAHPQKRGGIVLGFLGRPTAGMACSSEAPCPFQMETNGCLTAHPDVGLEAGLARVAPLLSSLLSQDGGSAPRGLCWPFSPGC